MTPPPPKHYWLPLFENYVPPDPLIDPKTPILIPGSIVNETGYVDCKKLIDRYNNDPRIAVRNATITEKVLVPDDLKFKFSVNNQSGNFNGDLTVRFDNIKIEKNLTTGGYMSTPHSTTTTYFGNKNNLATLYVSILHQNFYDLWGNVNTTFSADALTRIFFGLLRDN